MFPVLLSIDKFSVSSFGVFLGLGFIFGVFLVWRLARAWDLNEEKILDLTLLTLLGGLIGARLYFVLTHFPFFADDIFKIILFTKYPGFSFWGAFLGGWLSLSFFSQRKKMDFWQIADIASVGFLGGLIIADLGCFLGGCGAGSVTKSFLGMPVVGLIGKRWPIQLFEAFLFFLCLMNIWSKATRFHQKGHIVALTLGLIGLIKILIAPLRQNQNQDFVFSLTLIILGITIYYKLSKKNILSDAKNFFQFIIGLFTTKANRVLVLEAFRKVWYNQKTSIAWKFRNLKKTLRRFNVRFTIKNNKLH